MKKSFRKLFFGILIFSAFHAFAGLPPTSLKGQSGSKVTTFDYLVPFNQATQTSGPTSLIETGNTNVLANPGWEGGTGSWTASAGVYTTTAVTAQLGSGAKAGSWDSAAAADTLISTAVAIPAGSYGRNGAASCQFLCASGTCTHKIQAWDGTNILSEETITSSTTVYERTSVNFVYPSSGNIQLRIYSNANEPIVYLDNCYLGLAEGYNIASASQAQFIGSAYFATTANCAFTRTNTALGAMTDVDCPGPTVELNPGPGVIQTTDVDAPKVTVNSLPPGIYEIVFTGPTIVGTGAVPAAMSISDGTTTSGQMGTNGGVNHDAPFALVGYFTYTTSATRYFEIFASSTSNNVDIPIMTGNRRLTFSIKRFPTSAETIARPDQTPASWSGYHDSTCAWTRTNTVFGAPAADASCAFTERQNRNFGTVTSTGAKTPGITFTPTRAGRYLVIAGFHTSGSSVAASTSFQLVDGGSVVVATAQNQPDVANNLNHVVMQGVYNSASAGSAVTLDIQMKSSAGDNQILAYESMPAIEWTIFQLDAPFPTPVFTVARASVIADTANGYGSTNTMIRRFTNSATVGTALTLTQSAVDGDKVTVNSPGMYTITYYDNFNAVSIMGISKNSSELTTSVYSITIASTLAKSSTGGVDHTGEVSWTGFLDATDVIRAHTGGAAVNTSTNTKFSMQRIGN